MNFTALRKSILFLLAIYIWPPIGFCRPGRPHPWQRRNFWPAKHLLTPHERTPSISVADWLCGPQTNLVTCVINPLKVKNNVLYVKISSSHLTENTVSFHQEDQTVYAVQRITAVYNTRIVWNRIHKYNIWAKYSFCLAEFAKLRKATISFAMRACLSIWLYGTIQFRLDEFPRNFIFEYFSKNMPRTFNFN